MNTPRHSIACSAFGAAWSLALGMVGVAGQRQAGNGPAPPREAIRTGSRR